jgi:hypothetical protein
MGLHEYQSLHDVTLGVVNQLCGNVNVMAEKAAGQEC